MEWRDAYTHYIWERERERCGEIVRCLELLSFFVVIQIAHISSDVWPYNCERVSIDCIYCQLLSASRWKSHTHAITHSWWAIIFNLLNTVYTVFGRIYIRITAESCLLSLLSKGVLTLKLKGKHSFLFISFSMKINWVNAQWLNASIFSANFLD